MVSKLWNFSVCVVAWGPVIKYWFTQNLYWLLQDLKDSCTQLLQWLEHRQPKLMIWESKEANLSLIWALCESGHDLNKIMIVV